MRLLDLHLLRFGPFTDRRLDFETGGARLHVIFGSNEAGKSTILRAVSGLLFGIPETTRDHHIHAMPELRIGGRLENRAGRRVRIVRRKGRKDTLSDPHGKLLDEAVLEPFLGGLTRELFETLFGLDHATLVEGGRDLLDGKGELGESLFSAGSGVRGIHALRCALQNEAEALFTPMAQKRALNLAIKKFQDAKREAHQRLLKPQAWQTLQERLRRATADLAEREQEHARIQAELNRLQRLRRVLPQLQKRQALLERKQSLRLARLVPESCTEERTRTLDSLRALEAQIRKCRDEQQACEQERAAIQLPEALLAREALLEDLRDPLGAQRKALHDLPGLIANAATAREEACCILRELGREPSLEGVEALRIDLAAQERIRRLAREGARLEVELSRARQDAARLEQAAQTLQRQPDAPAPVADSGPLRHALAEIRRRGALEEQARALEADGKRLKSRARTQLAALSLWRGALEQGAELPLPPLETVERFRADFEDLAGEQKGVKTRRDEAGKQLDETLRRIAVLEGQGAVPTEAELQSARGQRDSLWHQVRAWRLNGAQSGPVPERLLEDYEQRVAQADTVADRLWRDAERSARYATLSAERDRYQAQCTHLEEQRAALTRRQQELTEHWHKLWQPAGIEPLPPAEMRSWLGRHEKLVETVAQWQERERGRAELLDEIALQRDRCSRELVALNQAPAANTESLSALLQRADGLADRLDAAQRERSQWARDLDKAIGEAHCLNEALAGYERAWADWRRQWEQAVQPLRLGVDAGMAEAEAVLNGLARLFRKLEEAQGYQIRIEQIEGDAQRFAARVAELVQACAPELADMAPEAAAAALVSRLQQGREDRANQVNLDKRLQRLARDLDGLRREREAAQGTLERLLAEAGVASPQALEAAEQASKEYREVSAKLQEIEESLLAEGLPLEDLLAQARAADPDRLPAEIAALEQAQADLGQECARRREEVGSLKSESNAMDGGSRAALAAADAEEALAQIKTQVESYVRLKLSALLLDREIERYRECHQGPIVQRAGELFRRMTLEAFSGLGVDFGDGDTRVLVCIRADGRPVPVEGLSDGTRDQLYLALRLASLQQQGEQGEPAPLVIDDILINFDDGRARATLGLLGEIAGANQVLFFTHHRRLLELAREAVAETWLKVHDLDACAGSMKSFQGDL